MRATHWWKWQMHLSKMIDTYLACNLSTHDNSKSHKIYFKPRYFVVGVGCPSRSNHKPSLLGWAQIGKRAGGQLRIQNGSWLHAHWLSLGRQIFQNGIQNTLTQFKKTECIYKSRDICAQDMEEVQLGAKQLNAKMKWYIKTTKCKKEYS